MSSIVIEQDAIAVRNAFEVHRNASLDLLRLAKASIVSTAELDGSGGALLTELSFKPAGARCGEHELVLSVDFEFKISRQHFESDSDKGAELVILQCTFEVKYSLNPTFAPNAEQIEAFHSGNAVFNCWPFFREFIQNTVVRLNYPPPPVPFLRLQPTTTKSNVSTATRRRAMKRKTPIKKAS